MKLNHIGLMVFFVTAILRQCSKKDALKSLHKNVFATIILPVQQKNVNLSLAGERVKKSYHVNIESSPCWNWDSHNRRVELITQFHHQK